jgi:hypothetical protein
MLPQLTGLEEVIRRCRRPAQCALVDREGLVDHDASRHDSRPQRRKEIAL